MSEKAKKDFILIGDANSERFKFLQKFLEEEFQIDAVQVTTYEDFCQKVEPQTVAEKWRLLLIAYDLPLAENERDPDLIKYVAKFAGNADHPRTAYLIENTIPDILRSAGGVSLIRVPILFSDVGQRRLLISDFELFIDHNPRLPEIELKGDARLQEQIRSLSQGNKLEEGKRGLAELVRSFVICPKISVSAIGQGKSGARVFRIDCQKPVQMHAKSISQDKQLLLKLCDENDYWKIEAEVNGHISASKSLGDPTYDIHIPVIQSMLLSIGQESAEDCAAKSRSTGLRALCFDYLGGDLGNFLELETFLIANTSELKERGLSDLGGDSSQLMSLRNKLVRDTVKFLSEHWYMSKKKGRVMREKKKIWSTENAPETAYLALPPYCLAGRHKERIKSFLNSQAAELGGRFLEEQGWKEHCEKIRNFVNIIEGPTKFKHLDRQLKVILSPVHGDLNTKNIMLWQQNNSIFFLDFPFYQERGHALQDMAKLEAEVKFALMDCQKDSPKDKLLAYDYTCTQFNLWIHLEDALLKDRLEVQDWLENGFDDNVKMCFELVRQIRKTAKEVYEQCQPHFERYLDEYWPALLYQTLRIIGYDHISVFKRIFAVYSASSILDKLK